MSILHMFCKGESSNLLYKSSFDGTSWTGNRPLEHTGIDSNFAPCLLNGRLIFKAPHSNDLYFAEESNGLFDTAARLIVVDDHRNHSDHAVSGALYTKLRYYIGFKSSNDGALCAIWMDQFGQYHWDGGSEINLNVYNTAHLQPKSDQGPAVATYQGKLFFVYKGDGSDALYSMWFDGTAWFGDQKIANQGSIGNRISPESNVTPAIVVYNSLLYLICKGTHSDHLYTSYFDGTNWHGNTRISDQRGGISPQSDRTPAAAVFNGMLYIVYKGAGSNDLYTSWFDGSTWHGDRRISSMGPISPKTNVAPSLFTE